VEGVLRGQRKAGEGGFLSPISQLGLPRPPPLLLLVEPAANKLAAVKMLEVGKRRRNPR